MNKRSTEQLHDISTIAWDQRGIMAVETSIALIAFVVVASVFAFGVLNTGLLSSEKSQETVQAGMEKISANLTLRVECWPSGTDERRALTLSSFI